MNESGLRLRAHVLIAAAAGAAVGLVAGVRDAILVMGGAFDPWFPDSRAAFVYPLAQAALWAAIAATLALAGRGFLLATRLLARVLGGLSPPATAAGLLYLGVAAAAALLAPHFVPSADGSKFLEQGARFAPTVGRAVLWAGVVCAAAALLLSWMRRSRSVRRLLGAGVPLPLAAVVLVAAGTLVTVVYAAKQRGHDASTAATRAPNVLLVSIETLRADDVACHGGSRAKTPALDALAKDAVVFDSAYAAAPWTLPSLATLLTGRYPSECGFGRTGQEGRPLEYYASCSLSPETSTVAELLHDAGYSTAAQLTNDFLRRHSGLDRGIQDYRHAAEYNRLLSATMVGIARNLWGKTGTRRAELPDQNAAEPVTRAAMNWLSRRAKPPFFLWVHYFDPHLDYDPPGLSPDSHPQYFQPGRDWTDVDSNAVARGVIVASPRDRELLRELHGLEVTYMDQWLGRLLQALEARGEADNTLIIVTADHGEEFWEHGGFEHGHAMNDEVLHVPLLVRMPHRAGAGRRVATPVSLIDVMPTALEVVGVKAPLGLAGRSLLPMIDSGASTHVQRTLYAEGILYGLEQKWALQGGRPGSSAAIISRRFASARSGVKPAAAADSGDRAQERPRIQAGKPGGGTADDDLVEQLKRWSARMTSSAAASQERGRKTSGGAGRGGQRQRIDQLRSIGYVGE